jgi:hypothetical protein
MLFETPAAGSGAARLDLPCGSEPSQHHRPVVAAQRA